MIKHRIFTTSFESVYPNYVAKAEKKGRTKAEVDSVISWLDGYGQAELEAQIEKRTDFETFFAEAPKMPTSGVALQDLARQHSVTAELVSHLQARVTDLMSTTGSLAVFWGRSYVGLRETFEDGCRQHLCYLEQLHLDLDLARQTMAAQRSLKLRSARADAEALWIRADDLQREIDEREQFWRAEVEWALSLLGERKPTSWPPEPLREMAAAA